MTNKRKKLVAVFLSTFVSAVLIVPVFASSPENIYLYNQNGTQTHSFQDFFLQSIAVYGCTGDTTQASFSSTGGVACNTTSATPGELLSSSYVVATDGSGTADVVLTGFYLGSTGMFAVPTIFINNLTANVTEQIADSGTLGLLALIAGIPLAFYVIKKLIALVPKK